MRIFYNGRCIKAVSEGGVMNAESKGMLIAKYKFDCSKCDLFPVFNNGGEYEYTYIDEQVDEKDVMAIDIETVTVMTYDARPDENGILTTEYEVETPVLINAGDIVTRSIYSKELPTRIRFGEASSTPRDNGSLLEVMYLNITNKITHMNDMFMSCHNLIKVNSSNWDTSNVTSMSNLFYDCYSLTHVDVSKWNTSQVRYMNHIFNNCYSLSEIDVSNWDVRKAESMYAMFSDCSKLKIIDMSKWITSNLSNMGCMFDRAEQGEHRENNNINNPIEIIGLNNLNVSNVGAVGGLFLYNHQISSLDLSNWDWNKVNNNDWGGHASSCFKGMRNLVNLKAPKNISVSIDLTETDNLTVDSLMSIINNLKTVSTAKTLTLGTTNLAKLTEEQKAVATNKGWVIA